MHVAGGQIPQTIDGLTQLVKQPDSVVDTLTGQIVPQSNAAPPGLADTPARRAIRDDPKMTRDQKIQKLKELDAVKG